MLMRYNFKADFHFDRSIIFNHMHSACGFLLCEFQARCWVSEIYTIKNMSKQNANIVG